ncbi:MAG: SDR family NAD(P)-dependent oxidoreductase [Planctomycetales bacterium]|nr:SDR family NAD(P)-dependent oxidoreductase [Planctomycetales bacterium]
MTNTADSSNPNDIAIVGLALHVPDADTPQKFWQNLRAGHESVRQFSDADLKAAGVPAELLEHPHYVKSGVVLDGIPLFDAEFFGLSPKEAAIMDPQHRHFLECCWEALEFAGHPPEKFDGRIGVFAGCGMGAYFNFNLLTNPDLVQSVGMFLLRHTGNDKDFLATRVSYCFDLKGPSVNIQTACSTSLVAVHTACQSLLSGECDMALAGGVTIELPHGRGHLYKKNEILSPDGHCRAFDHRSQGTIFGSGAGVVALRRLEDALRDGDPIVAVVKGSAVNNDGASKVGYFAPSVDGQASAVAEALAVANVSAETVGYVECHGTGTPIGDPIEIAALTQAFRETTDQRGYCAIGSVKTNIGHLDTAAGVVGMAKAALALQNKQFPPSLNFEAPNPSIDFANSPFVVNDKLRDWPQGDTPRRAAINSLGVGGTNSHAVLEEAPATKSSDPARRPYQLLTLSARNRAALDDASKRLAARLREHPEQNLADVAYTLFHGRKKFDVRRVVAARDHAEAAALLESSDATRVFTHKAVDAKPSLVFMFPGGGAQYPRMARDLYEAEPVFKQWVDRGLALLDGKLDVDLRQLWFAPADQDAANQAQWERPSVQLPAIYLCEFALAQLWQTWGVKPAALLGHSLGENTAAALAGVFSFEDGLGLVALRGKLFERVAPGGMLSIPLAPEAILPLLGDKLDLATVNGPEFCTVSGPTEALDELFAKLAADGVDVKRVPIRIAAHSRLLQPILGEFENYLRSIKLKKPTLPIISNRTGLWLTEAQAVDPKYWVDHLRHTVRFADGVGTLLKTAGRVFLEVGPGKTLASFVRQHGDLHAGQTVVSSLRHPKESVSDIAFFTAVLGRLWASGIAFDDTLLWKGENRRRVVLPTYAFQRQSYWIEPGRGPAAEDSSKRDVGRLANLDDWFSRPIWRLRELETPEASLAPATWLLFLDEAGVGDRLAARLKQAGHEVVGVRPGDAFSQIDANNYVLSPEHGHDGYEALLRDLKSTGKSPDRIVHLWLTTADESFRPGSSFFHRNQEQGFYSLLFLAQSLASESASQPLHISVVTNGMQQTRDEGLPYPEKATVLGPVGVIPRELPQTTCATIDVALPGRARFGGKRRAAALDNLAEQLLCELQQPAGNGNVALRGDRRYEKGYTKFNAAKPRVEAESKPAIRPHGVYLITGGFGGIGLTVARHLATTAKAKLVLVGRSALPPVDQWDAWLRSHADDNAVSRKIRDVRELESFGAEVMAAEADVTDVEAVRRVVDEATKRFGAIHGVVHGAGTLHDNLISLKTHSEAEAVFAPKIHGALVLDEALRETTLDFFLLFSSTSTVTSPTGQVDYVAANAFLNAFAESRHRPERRYIALNWGIWNEVGMAAKAADRSPAKLAPAAEEQPVEHSLFDYRLGGLHDAKVTLVGRHAAATHWVYDEHRTAAGQALLPGTGYLELARAALAELHEPSALEIRDLYFLSPLGVDDDGACDVSATLTRDERGYTLEVASKSSRDKTAGPRLNAQARLVAVKASQPGRLDVQAIEGRCPDVRTAPAAGVLHTRQEEHLRFGPRWRVLKQTAYGRGEAVARLRLNDSFAGDLAQYALHPALMDLATGFAMDLIEGYAESSSLWVPVSYKRVACFAPLEASLISWVRNRGVNRADGAIASFDVTITDESGRVLVEIEDFAIKRLTESDAFGGANAVKNSPRSEIDAEDDAETMSPAEARFLANLRNGIRPAEGVDALLKVLDGPHQPQVIVSSLDLSALIAQADVPAAGPKAEPGAKFARPQLDGEFIAPRDNVERSLVAIWEELLGVTSIGVRDSFFELGGHSLIAVRLFAQIKRAFQVDFPMSVLFEAPTVESCAALIRSEIGEAAAGDHPPGEAAPAKHQARYTHLVAMHEGAGTSQRPLYIVAGMFGNVLNLRHLAHLVGHDRPCYGLQARGLYGDHAPHATFEEAAADYLRELRTVQPHGPYLLAGFSGGGLTAYEMTRQLIADGEQVAFLGMLDTPLPRSEALTTLDKVKMHGQRIAREKHRYFWNFVAGRIAWEWGRLRKRLGGQVEEPAGGAQFQSAAIEQAFRAACEVYQPPRFDGRLWLFRPKLQPTHVFEPDRMINVDRRFIYHDNGWSRHVRDVHVVEVPGDHDSMVLEPNVRVLGAKLRAAIAEAEAQTVRSSQAAEPIDVALRRESAERATITASQVEEVQA